ncbi:DUF6612 family protein [Falsibacillus pallidus]|uniref:DUF6612 family protein n=1 Tax=Falsibacillus pallidus TaxID=493781 RepID=UPI003D98B693
MKKITSAIVMLVLVFSLAACNQTAKQVDSGKKESSEKDSKSTLTLEQVFEKSLDASKDVKSLSAVMDLKQHMESSQQSAPIQTVSHIEMEMVQKPLSLHQKMKMEMGDASGDAGNDALQNYETESYLTKDGFFMFDPTQQKWMKMPKEFSDQIMQMSDYQTNPGDELKKLKQYADDFSFEQDDKHFILKLKASGDKFDQLLKDSMNQMMPEQLKENEGMLKNIKFNGAEYEILINKETFLTDALNMTTDIEMKVDDTQSLQMKQEMKGTYSDYNKNLNITVPQDILDNAQEVNF